MLHLYFIILQLNSIESLVTLAEDIVNKFIEDFLNTKQKFKSSDQIKV